MFLILFSFAFVYRDIFLINFFLFRFAYHVDVKYYKQIAQTYVYAALIYEGLFLLFVCLDSNLGQKRSESRQ